jgi:uncharacterized phage protein (TIGR01671 family)
MREIKFRAWDNNSKHMYYSDSHKDAELLGARVGDSVLETFVHKFLLLFMNNLPQLMQYTGLKDKQGKEIYEGDIVRFIEYGYERQGQIKWDDGVAAFCVRFKFGALAPMTINMISQGLGSYETIGNIYESPELLKRVIY